MIQNTPYWKWTNREYSPHYPLSMYIMHAYIYIMYKYTYPVCFYLLLLLYMDACTLSPPLFLDAKRVVDIGGKKERCHYTFLQCFLLPSVDNKKGRAECCSPTQYTPAGVHQASFIILPPLHFYSVYVNTNRTLNLEALCKH